MAIIVRSYIKKFFNFASDFLHESRAFSREVIRLIESSAQLEAENERNGEKATGSCLNLIMNSSLRVAAAVLSCGFPR